jgi:peptide/nickel transport system ATP-binding protein
MSTERHPPLLQVRDLHVHFASPSGPVRAVNGVSFDLAAGETLGIVGESGSGKSVAMRTIAGLITSEPGAQVRGSVSLGENELLTLSSRRRRRIVGARVSMVFQNPLTALNPVLRVGDQIAEPLRVHGSLSRSAARERAVELLERVRIPDADRRAAQYPHQLSGGMRQRVGIAIALACNPAVLIADEPTTALDVTVQKQVLDLLASLRATTSLAMILITHDLGVVAGRTDRVAVMYAGRVVETAPTDVLFASPQHPYTAALLNATPRLDRPSGSRLRSIPGQPPDLVAEAVGCPFALRCEHAQDLCAVETPELQLRPADHDRGREFACHFPLVGQQERRR